jgi:hypothetical protein
MRRMGKARDDLHGSREFAVWKVTTVRKMKVERKTTKAWLRDHLSMGSPSEIGRQGTA